MKLLCYFLKCVFIAPTNWNVAEKEEEINRMTGRGYLKPISPSISQAQETIEGTTFMYDIYVFRK